MSSTDGTMKRRICPIISSGKYLQYCKGAGCNAARARVIDGFPIWYCALISPEGFDEK